MALCQYPFGLQAQGSAFFNLRFKQNPNSIKWNNINKQTIILTVFLTGLDKHWMIRGIPPTPATIVALAGSAKTKYFYLSTRKITNQIEITIPWKVQQSELPTQELQIPPTPNSIIFSLGSVTQSRKSSKTFSCKYTRAS